MRDSRRRIPTSHAGSLPRPDELIANDGEFGKAMGHRVNHRA